MLCDAIVKVVLNHGHDCSRLLGFCRIFIYRTGVHLVIRTETIHVYASVLLEFLCKFLCQGFMMLYREISQCVLYCKNLFLCTQDLFALGSMIDCRIIRFWLWQLCRNSCQYIFVELIHESLRFCCLRFPG